MNRTVASLLLIAVFFLTGAWLWMKLQTKAAQSVAAGINRQMDQIAPDSTRKIPALQRVRNATEQTRRQAEDNTRMLDSMTRAAAE
jgi:hypothetical protein